MSLRIDFLHHFILLAEEKSFSKVAENISITQGALSHQIAYLEEYFNCSLIDRSTRTFKLTKQGEFVVEYSKKIIRLLDDCNQKISKLSDKYVETIKISASTIPGIHILPEFIATFKNKNPNTNFNMQIKNSKQSLYDLKKEQVQFTAVGSFIENNKDDFDYFPIYSEKLVFICSPDHDLITKKKDKILFEDIIKYPFISREDGSGTRQTIQEQFDKYDQLNHKLEMTNNEAIISAVSKSDDISIISEISAKKAENANLIKIINVSDIKPIKRELYIIKKKDKTLNKLAMKFWKFVFNNRD